MTDEQILDIANSGHMLKKAADTEKKRMPHDMYEMYINVGNTLITCSREIRTLLNQADMLKKVIEELREKLKQSDIKDIKSEGKISHEDTL